MDNKYPIDIEALIAGLTASSESKRLESIRALGESHVPRAVETLITAFDKVRKLPGCAVEYSAIAISLGQIGTARAVEALINVNSG